jgi:hypothetical protein
MTKKSIPNYNSISTLFDRLIIERVKYNQFKQREINSQEDCMYKLEAQDKIISRLRDELEKELKIIFKSQSYDTILEERTFK